MNNESKKLLDYVLPFIGLGILVVLLIVGIVLAFHLIIWGTLVGLILFGIAYIRAKFFRKKGQMTANIYEHKED